jgi:hypothetical protein
MRESQQLFFVGRLVSRMFEEYQQPVIQTKIVPCPQKRSTLEDGKRRYPNLKREPPAFFMKLNMDEITACGYTNRVPKKQEIGGTFV